MTPQLLIIKIQSLINGTTQFDNGQLKLLASEYKKLYKQSAQRLEQCISLIKTNRDYLALELAESEPPLLDTINTISFPELVKWNELCELHSVAICPRLDDYYIELLQSLYTKNIGQTHPLYRDYRRAMRMHNFRNALKIISTISKINSNDFEIKQEYQRLLSAEIEHSFAKIKDALSSGKKAEALELYNFLDSNKESFNQEEKSWDEIKTKADAIKKENALVHQGEIIEELKHIDAKDNWERCLNIIEELKFLQAEYSLAMGDDILALIDNTKATASAKKKKDDQEKLKLATTANAQAILNTENKAVPSSTRLSLYKKLRKDKNLLAEDVLKKLNKRISSLSWLLFFKNILKLGVISCIIAASVAGYYYANKKFEASEKQSLSINELAQLDSNNSVGDMQMALDKYKKDYPDFLKKNELSLNKIESKIELQKTYLAQVDSLLLKIEQELNGDLTSLSIKTIESDISSGEKILIDMLDNDASAYRIKLEEAKKAYLLKLEGMQDAYEESLKKAISKAEKLVEALNFDLSKSSIDAINNAKLALANVEEISATNANLFELSPSYKTKLDDLNSTLDVEEAKLNDFLSMKKAIANSHKLNDYFDALKELQFNTVIPENLRKNITDILALDTELKYGSDIKDFSKEEIENAFESNSLENPESLPSDLLSLSDIYTYNNAEQTVYTQGELKEEKTSSWGTGYESKQTGKVFSDRGVANFIQKMKLVENNQVSKDETYTNGELSKESVFVNQLQAEKHSILKLINMVQASDTDPVFKAWIENELFEMAKLNPAKSGILYNNIAQERAKLVKKYSMGLNKLSWIRQNPNKRKEVEYALYRDEIVDLESDALNRLSLANAIANRDLNIIGFVDENGELSINASDFSVDIYAVDLQGREVLLIKNGKLLTKAMPFSPLLTRD